MSPSWVVVALGNECLLKGEVMRPVCLLERVDTSVMLCTPVWLWNDVSPPRLSVGVFAAFISASCCDASPSLASLSLPDGLFTALPLSLLDVMVCTEAW